MFIQTVGCIDPVLKIYILLLIKNGMKNEVNSIVFGCILLFLNFDELNYIIIKIDNYINTLITVIIYKTLSAIRFINTLQITL